ncbi:choice-of-anchor X domain-containing protein [Nevskia sp.]|uniref:DUF4785 family immunoglobulin-like domain-containing protein n=1 Tax=Nevskia sp. TaxID=1929292 RepID=UPI0025E76DBA|nr:choice-of-anchor X domain-containing protein [Nevskia sp.]
MKTNFVLMSLAAALIAPAAVAQNATVPSLTAQAAADYRAQARYPRSSRPILDAVDPLSSGRTVSKQTMAGPNGAGPLLSVWASAISYEPGESALLYAELTDAPARAPSLANLLDKTRRDAAQSIKAKLIGETSGLLGEVVYRDDGRDGDARANDRIYTARYTLPAARAPELGYAEAIGVHVQAVTELDGDRAALGGLLYSNPGARLTGKFRDVMRDGHLVMSAEVDVRAPGRYHLAGTLSGAREKLVGDRPMAWAQQAQLMTAGTQWMDLSFHGLIFRDLKSSGRYTLNAVTLTSALGMPNAMSSVRRDAHQTRAMALSEFSDKPFVDAALADAAQRLEADAAGSQ